MFCIARSPFELSYVDPHTHATVTFVIEEGEPFILLKQSEIQETNTIEYEVLFENKKMWFNIRQSDCIIDNVRRAKSYDIPFMAFQEAEPGSNSPPRPSNPPNRRPRASSHIYKF